MKLNDIAYFVEDKISSENIKLDQYVTTDSLLQNKKGRTFAQNLPPQKCSLVHFKKGDVLLGNIRPYLKKIWYANIEGGCSQDVLVLRAKNNLESKFLYALLMQDSFFDYEMKATKGSKMPRGDKSHIINFPCLDLNNKTEIGKLLSSLDDKIALNNRIKAKLEQMAKRLYDYWFVQFDFPNADGKPYKSTGGKMVWNEELKREIPEGWEVKKISEILDCEIPGDWGEEEIKGNHKYKVNCIRGCDMVDMTDLPVRYILESNSKKLLQKDDFVIEISGGSPTQSTGRIVQITDEIIKRFNGKIICSNFCHGIRLNDKDYASYFFQMWNMFYLNNIFFNYEGKTSGLKNFQFDTFVSETWYVPPKELVRKYHEVVSKFRKQIDINESETQKLTVLRDRLLPLLMNGQVEVE